MSTKNLVLLSISTALQVALLLVTLMIPTIKLSMLVAASLLNGLMIKSDIKKQHVLVSYVATSLLSFLLISNYIVPITYVCFFGWYGIIHYTAENKSMIVKQIIRWSALAISVAVCFFAFNSIFMSNDFLQAQYLYVVIPVGVVAYVVFQWAYGVIVSQIYNYVKTYV